MLVAKSVNDVSDYVSQFEFDVVVCDLVFGNLTASELFERVRGEDCELPRFLCLLGEQSLNSAEVNSLRAMQDNESVDVMKKPILTTVLDSYLQDFLDSKDQCGDSASREMKQTKATTTAATTPVATSRPDHRKVCDEIHRLDSQHKELVTGVSMLQQKVAALEKGMPELTSTLDSD